MRLGIFPKSDGNNPDQRLKRSLSALFMAVMCSLLPQPGDALSYDTFDRYCPVDQTHFHGPFGSSDLNLEGELADLAHKPDDNYPAFSENLRICPNCHFVGTDQDFSRPVSKSFRSYILTNWKPIPLPQHISYGEKVEIALVQYHNQGRSAYEMGVLALEASYYYHPLYRQVFSLKHQKSAQARRKFFQELARQYFSAAWQQQTLPAEKRGAVAYLLGELARRHAEFETAHHWFKLALEHTPLPDHLHQRILQQQKLAEHRNADDTL